jgi:hypothetical protein
MFGRRRGKWFKFDEVNPQSKSMTLVTSCVSTSAEMAGHFKSVVVSKVTPAEPISVPRTFLARAERART